MILSNEEQKALIAIFDIVKNSEPISGSWTKELPKLVKGLNDKYCSKSKQSLKKLESLLIYPYKFNV